jgi:hypothetical protein
MYISDGKNYRILKWPLGASQGIVVAGKHKDKKKYLFE